jgi:hypothetical protein
VQRPSQKTNEIRFTRLEGIPIEDAFHEKLVFEKGESERKLCPQRYPGPILVTADARCRRVLEVYRRCFEEADDHTREKVIGDFVAHFPHLSFDADWLSDLVRAQSALPGVANDSKRKRILLAMAKGFSRAARTKKRQPAIQKFYHLHAARTVQRAFCDELKRWNVDLERSVSDPAWVAEREASKAKELADTYRQLLLGDKRRLTKLLQQGQCYEASVLVAFKVFGVRARDLQRKSD